jgi:WD40-like Beta Propeller Repeat/WD domain, G-beta repeat
MSGRLRTRLETTPLDPGAESRAWGLVRAAYAERTAARRRTELRVAVAAAVLGTVTVAAAFSPPGRAVVDAVRRSIGIEHAAPALFRLPAPGRLLVSTPTGSWVVAADGSKRRLGPYGQAAWSPHALYVAAATRNGLAAVDASGTVYWTLARPGISLPAWGGTRTDTRVAYLSQGRLHVVGGDGRGDRSVGRVAPVRPAWRPSQPGTFVLARVTSTGRVVVGVPGRAPLWRSAVYSPRPRLLAWSPDGRRLAIATSRQLFVLDGRTGAAAVRLSLTDIRSLAYGPGGRLAVARSRSIELVARHGSTRTLFSAPSRPVGLAWSPDGRWLLTSLPRSDQWVFVGRRVLAVSNIRAQFGGAASLDGWAPGA